MHTHEYRPTFNFATSLVVQFPLQLFFSFWGGGFFGSLASNFMPSIAHSHFLLNDSIAWTIGLTVFLLFPFFTLSAKWLNYRNTIYRLHADRLEIEEGFFTKRSKEIRVSAVREISLKRGILQRMVGLGSVYLATQATGQGYGWQSSAFLGASSTFGSGAMLMDLTDSDAAYKALKTLIDRQPEKHA